uniref:Uncharacterized protein n=1 Tax=Arundo donax TaxID=35708 RepID=A0A0A9AV31_ARUDO
MHIFIRCDIVKAILSVISDLRRRGCDRL